MSLFLGTFEPVKPSAEYRVEMFGEPSLDAVMDQGCGCRAIASDDP